jgi:hypothetical protein
MSIEVQYRPPSDWTFGAKARSSSAFDGDLGSATTTALPPPSGSPATAFL